MSPPIKLISTDFDGTLFSEFDSPQVPPELEELIGNLQSRGAKWAINTGRDLPSLTQALGAARVSIRPDFLVLVEREIHVQDGVKYIGLGDWNARCRLDHQELFKRVRPDVPRLGEWIHARFRATVYEDAYSPFCLIAGNGGDADVIHAYLDDYCRSVPQLSLMRNDVYSRFCHAAYNKGTALAELGKRLEITPDEIFAAGDHLNDLPMLSLQYASWLAAPKNAVPAVKEAVRRQRGFVSHLSFGAGVAQGLAFHLAQAGR